METVRIGVREFREKLAGYLESGMALAIMRHSETLGFFIPAQKRNRKAELEAMRAAAKDLDELITELDCGEDELAEVFAETRSFDHYGKRLDAALAVIEPEKVD
jgi:hypothetical protein